MKLSDFEKLKPGDPVTVYQHGHSRKTTVGELCMTGYATPLIKFGRNQIAFYEDVYILPRDAEEMLDHVESDAFLLESLMKELRLMVQYGEDYGCEWKSILPWQFHY